MQEYEEDEKPDRKDGVPFLQREMEPEGRKFSFYNNNPNKNGRDGTKDEGKDSEGVEEGVLKDRNVLAVSHGLTNEIESAKRR